MGNESSKRRRNSETNSPELVIAKYEKEWLITWDSNVTHGWLKFYIDQQCNENNYKCNSIVAKILNQFIDI